MMLDHKDSPYIRGVGFSCLVAQLCLGQLLGVGVDPLPLSLSLSLYIYISFSLPLGSAIMPSQTVLLNHFHLLPSPLSSPLPFGIQVGFLYLRYVCNPREILRWFEKYFQDNDELKPSPGSMGRTITVGEFVRDILLDQVGIASYPLCPASCMQVDSILPCCHAPSQVCVSGMPLATLPARVTSSTVGTYCLPLIPECPLPLAFNNLAFTSSSPLLPHFLAVLL
jgi:hypothetical protein